MQKIDQFNDYRKLLTIHDNENKKIDENLEFINQIASVIDYAKEQIQRIKEGTTPVKLLHKKNEALIMDIGQDLYNEMYDFKDEYLTTINIQDKANENYEFNKQKEKEEQQSKLIQTSDTINLILDKTNVDSVDHLTVEAIECWIERDPEAGIRDTDIKEAETAIQRHEIHMQDQDIRIEGIFSQLSDDINNRSNWQIVHHQIAKLSNYNLVDKDFPNSIKKAIQFDYSSYSLDQIITKINRLPSLDTNVKGYPKWVSVISDKLFPILFFIASAIVVFGIPDISGGISILLVSLGGLILQYVIPLLVGFFLFNLLYYDLPMSGLKSFSISVIITFILWWIIKLLDITSGMHDILTFPIMLLLVGGITYLGWKLNWQFEWPRKLEQFIQSKPIFFKEERMRINEIIDNNIEGIYLAYNIPEIVQFYSQQMANKLIEENTVISNELYENLYLAQEQWRKDVNDKANYYLQLAYECQNFQNNYQSVLDEIDKKYADMAFQLDINTKNSLEEIETRFQSKFDTWISKISDYIEAKRQHIIELEEYQSKIMMKHEATTSELIHKGGSLFLNNVSEQESKGIFPNVFFVDQSHKNSNPKIKEFQKIEHNQHPLVFLYDYENDANLSEKLYDSIQLLYQALFSVYPLDLIELIITDIQNHAFNFKQQENLGILSIINDIPTLAKYIASNMSDISTMANSIDEYNQVQETKFGNSATYKKQIVSIFIVPDLSKQKYNQKLTNEELWKVVNNGYKLGFLPIFFINRENWINTISNEPESFINRIKASYGDSKTNVYTLDRDNNINIFQEEV